MSIFDDFFYTVEVVVVWIEVMLDRFNNVFEHWVDEVKMQSIVPYEVSHRTAHYYKQCFSTCVLICRFSDHLRSEIKVVNIHRYVAVPSWDQLCGFVVCHLGYAAIVYYHRPPQSATHLGFKYSVFGVRSLVGDIQTVSNSESNSEQR